ncbi:unnamed protein product, partial [Meganyctiphanes norvegica]
VIRDRVPSVDHWPHMHYLWTAFHWLAMSHTCYHPIILGWMNKKFRDCFFQVAWSVWWCCGGGERPRRHNVPMAELNNSIRTCNTEKLNSSSKSLRVASTRVKYNCHVPEARRITTGV